MKTKCELDKRLRLVKKTSVSRTPEGVTDLRSVDDTELSGAGRVVYVEGAVDLPADGSYRWVDGVANEPGQFKPVAEPPPSIVDALSHYLGSLDERELPEITRRWLRHTLRREG